MNILDQKWLSTKQVADYLDIGYTTVRLWTSKGYFPSTTHRVINPSAHNVSRYSMPFFVHARDEVVLSKEYTAKSYLEERLKEIGLKYGIK